MADLNRRAFLLGTSALVVAPTAAAKFEYYIDSDGLVLNTRIGDVGCNNLGANVDLELWGKYAPFREAFAKWREANPDVACEPAATDWWNTPADRYRLQLERERAVWNDLDTSDGSNIAPPGWSDTFTIQHGPSGDDRQGGAAFDAARRRILGDEGWRCIKCGSKFSDGPISVRQHCCENSRSV